MKLAFIGTGNMGFAMARNLLHAGHRVVVYNRTRAHAEPLQQDGATLAESAAEAAGDVDGVITMLADDAAVEHAAGFLDTLAAGAPPHRHEHRQRGLLQIACRRARHARAILRRRAGVRATRGGRRR